MSTNWDAMRGYEERMRELKEQAAEEGIEINEESMRNAMEVLYGLLPPGTNPTEEAGRLLKHRETAESPPDQETKPDAETPEDEWRIPQLNETGK